MIDGAHASGKKTRASQGKAAIDGGPRFRVDCHGRTGTRWGFNAATREEAEAIRAVQLAACSLGCCEAGGTRVEILERPDA